MAINFPDTPNLNDEFAVGDRVWIWNGTVWKSKETAILETGKYIVSETAPLNPEEGDAWFDSLRAKEFIYYDSFWVETSAAAVGLPAGGYATETYVDTAVAGLVDSAPDTLNTLNELSAALGDDADFATTVTNSLAGKIDSTEKGANDGVATLDANGQVPATQLGNIDLSTKADIDHTHVSSDITAEARVISDIDQVSSTDNNISLIANSANNPTLAIPPRPDNSPVSGFSFNVINAGTSPLTLQTSQTALDWASPETPTLTDQYGSLFWNNQMGYWLLAANNKIYKSTAINGPWIEKATLPDAYTTSAYSYHAGQSSQFDYQDGVLIASGASILKYSVDEGETWSTATIEGTSSGKLSSFSYLNGIWISTIANGSSTKNIYRSADGGQTWNQTGIQTTGTNFVTTTALTSINRFAVFTAGNIYYSDDYGVTWQTTGYAASNRAGYASASNGTVAVVSEYYSPYLKYSTDLLNWTAVPNGITPYVFSTNVHPMAIEYFPHLNKFLANQQGRYGTARVWQSVDGQNWTLYADDLQLTRPAGWTSSQTFVTKLAADNLGNIAIAELYAVPIYSGILTSSIMSNRDEAIIYPEESAKAIKYGDGQWFVGINKKQEDIDSTISSIMGVY